MDVFGLVCHCEDIKEKIVEGEMSGHEGLAEVELYASTMDCSNREDVEQVAHVVREFREWATNDGRL